MAEADGPTATLQGPGRKVAVKIAAQSRTTRQVPGDHGVEKGDVGGDQCGFRERRRASGLAGKLPNGPGASLTTSRLEVRKAQQTAQRMTSSPRHPAISVVAEAGGTNSYRGDEKQCSRHVQDRAGHQKETNQGTGNNKDWRGKQRLTRAWAVETAFRSRVWRDAAFTGSPTGASVGFHVDEGPKSASQVGNKGRFPRLCSSSLG